MSLEEIQVRLGGSLPGFCLECCSIQSFIKQRLNETVIKFMLLEHGHRHVCIFLEICEKINNLCKMQEEKLHSKTNKKHSFQNKLN